MSSEGEEPDRSTEARNAFAFILAKLARRDHTEKELERALARKGFSEAAVESAIARSRREGLVNDERVARAVARVSARSGRRGPLRVVAALQQKGISREAAGSVVKEVFAESSEGEERLIGFAAKLLEKAKGDTLKERRIRVLRSLISRGFELEAARRALRLAENASDDRK